MSRATDVTRAAEKAAQAVVDAASSEQESIKAQLDAMPKQRVRIPIPADMDPEKAKKLFVPVQVNGYTYQIMRGEWVEVPTVVADILAEANYI